MSPRQDHHEKREGNIRRFPPSTQPKPASLVLAQQEKVGGFGEFGPIKLWPCARGKCFAFSCVGLIKFHSPRLSSLTYYYQHHSAPSWCHCLVGNIKPDIWSLPSSGRDPKETLSQSAARLLCSRIAAGPRSALAWTIPIVSSSKRLHHKEVTQLSVTWRFGYEQMIDVSCSLRRNIEHMGSL